MTLPTRCALAFLALAALAPPAAAAWLPQGTPVHVAAGDQGTPTVAVDGTGGAYVLWSDGPTDSARIGAHRLDASGVPSAWPAVDGVLDPGPAGAPLAIADGAGGVYVAWPDSARGVIHVQRFQPDGGVAPGWPAGGVLQGIAGDVLLRIETVSLDAQGGVVVSWRFNWRQCHGPGPSLCHNHGPFVAVTRIGADGVLSWTREIRDPEGQNLAQAVPDGPGGAFFAWHDMFVGELRLLRFTPLGANSDEWPLYGVVIAAAPEFAVGDRVRLLESPADGALAVWTGIRDGQPAVFFQHVLDDGSLAMPVATCVCSLGAAPELQGIVPDGAGGVIAVWKDARDGLAKLYAVRWLADGSVATGWNRKGSLVCMAPGARGRAAVAPDGAGGALIVWEDDRNKMDLDLYAQRLRANGTLAPGWPAGGLPISTAPGDQRAAVVATTPDGVARIAWEDLRGPGTGPDIYALAIEGDGTTPVRWALARVVPRADEIRLEWRASEPGAIATVSRRAASAEWRDVGIARADGRGVLEFRDRDVVAGARYGYRLLGPAREPLTEETWVDVPRIASFGLRLAGPNPLVGARELVAEVTLEGPDLARLELIDLGGRVVAGRALRSVETRATLGAAHRFPPGVYWMRLTQGPRHATIRVALTP